jgi:hypothetical protein
MGSISVVTEARMAARAIASITVSFGMVSIPVKLYSATQPSVQSRLWKEGSAV